MLSWAVLGGAGESGPLALADLFRPPPAAASPPPLSGLLSASSIAIDLALARSLKEVSL